MPSSLTKAVKKQLKKIVHPTIRKWRPAPDLPRAPFREKVRSEDGTSIDEFFTRRFLQAHSSTIKGQVLEFGGHQYAEQFGSEVQQGDTLTTDESLPSSSLLGILTQEARFPDSIYDCIILIDVLHRVFELEEAVEQLHRLLKPGGTLLLCVPCNKSFDPHSPAPDLWRFTVNSCHQLFRGKFEREKISTEPCGNMFTTLASLSGITAEALDASDLGEACALYYQSIGVRAEKST